MLLSNLILCQNTDTLVIGVLFLQELWWLGPWKTLRGSIEFKASKDNMKHAFVYRYFLKCTRYVVSIEPIVSIEPTVTTLLWKSVYLYGLTVFCIFEWIFANKMLNF